MSVAGAPLAGSVGSAVARLVRRAASVALSAGSCPTSDSIAGPNLSSAVAANRGQFHSDQN